MNNIKFLIQLCAVMIATAFCQNNAVAQEAVDLGLPSGTLWADRNVGAEDVCKCGEYVAYGETSSKGNYTWDTYEYASGKKKLALSKYVEQYPTVNKLNAPVDVANVKMGGDWVTPTREDFMELLDNCDIQIVRNYKNTGVRGLMVYNRSDRSKSIFIPGCGVAKGSKLYNSDIGKNGLVMLWTATTNLKFNANQAYYFSADDGNGGGGRAYTNISETDYCVGMAVRGVSKKNQTNTKEKVENEIKFDDSSFPAGVMSFSDLVGKKIKIDFHAGIKTNGKRNTKPSGESDYFIIDDKLENVSFKIFNAREKFELNVKQNGKSLDVVGTNDNRFLKTIQLKRLTISYKSGNKIAIDLKGRMNSRMYCRILEPGDDANKEVKFSDYKFAD